MENCVFIRFFKRGAQIPKDKFEKVLELGNVIFNNYQMPCNFSSCSGHGPLQMSLITPLPREKKIPQQHSNEKERELFFKNQDKVVSNIRLIMI
jgi:hypothetical protein